MKGEFHLLRSWATFAAAALIGDSDRVPATPHDLPSPPLLRVSRLGPYLYEALRLRGDGRARLLRAEVLAQALEARVLSEIAHTVGERLASLGIEHVFLKGVAVAQILPESAPVRITSDVDVLVSPGGFAVAEGALEDLGFMRATFQRPIHQTIYYERVYGREEAGRRLLVDLHRGLAAWPVGRDLARAAIDSRSDSSGLSVTSPELATMIAGLHYAKQEPTRDVRDAFDLLLLLREFDERDCRRLARRAERLGVGGALLALTKRVDWLLGGDVRITWLRGALHDLMNTTRRWCIEQTLDPRPADPGSTPRRLLGDWWRHSLCLGGPMKATVEHGIVAGALGLDRLSRHFRDMKR